MRSADYSCQILMNSKFLDKVSKRPKISNFMKIHPIESFHADRQTEMRKLMVALAIMRKHLKLLHSVRTRHLYILYGSQKKKILSFCGMDWLL